MRPLAKYHIKNIHHIYKIKNSLFLMARKKTVTISTKFLGGLILLAILFQYLLPQIGINFLSKLSLAIYLFVGIYLFFF